MSRPLSGTDTLSVRPGQQNTPAPALPPALRIRPGGRARTPSCASAQGAAAGAGGPAPSGAWPSPSHAATHRPGLCHRREAVGAFAQLASDRACGSRSGTASSKERRHLRAYVQCPGASASTAAAHIAQRARTGEAWERPLHLPAALGNAVSSLSGHLA